MLCTSCGIYFRLSRFNQSPTCEMCLDDVKDCVPYESDYEADVQAITNPTGKTKPVFLDEGTESIDYV